MKRYQLTPEEQTELHNIKYVLLEQKDRLNFLMNKIESREQAKLPELTEDQIIGKHEDPCGPRGISGCNPLLGIIHELDTLIKKM